MPLRCCRLAASSTRSSLVLQVARRLRWYLVAAGRRVEDSWLPSSACLHLEGLVIIIVAVIVVVGSG